MVLATVIPGAGAYYAAATAAWEGSLGRITRSLCPVLLIRGTAHPVSAVLGDDDAGWATCHQAVQATGAVASLDRNAEINRVNSRGEASGSM